MKFVLLTIILLSSGLLLTLSFEADTKTRPELSHNDLIALKNELSQYSPFKQRQDTLVKIKLSEKTINQATQLLLVNYANIPTNIHLSDGYVVITASPAIPFLSNNVFANIRFSVFVKNNELMVKDASIGLLSIPSALIAYFTPVVENFLRQDFPETMSMIKTIKDISIKKNEMLLSYQWSRNLAQQSQQLGKNLLFNTGEQELVAIYYKQLGKFPYNYLRKDTSISSLLQFLFQFAKKRVEAGNNIVEEHKAILLTLGIMASGIKIGHLIKGGRKVYLRHISFGQLKLAGRSDLMRHFLISAALTASTNKAFTNTIGLSKEIDDADGGSGFSFADLLADRAGIAFAKLALSNQHSAQLQKVALQNSFSEALFMPSYKNLPEAISIAKFKKHYVSVKNERYLTIEREIQRRIEQLPLYSK